MTLGTQIHETVMSEPITMESSAPEIDTTCPICTCPMTWPTLLHCKEHVICFKCCWAWLSKFYRTNSPGTYDLKPTWKYELTELQVEYNLSKCKCPYCHQHKTVSMDDETLNKITLLPMSLQALYPDAEKWICPFCGIVPRNKDHLLTCLERKFQCTRAGCNQMVSVQYKSVHALECTSYICPHPTCELWAKKRYLSAFQYFKHQKLHKQTQGVIESDEEEEEEENSDEDYDEELDEIDEELEEEINSGSDDEQ